MCFQIAALGVGAFIIRDIELGSHLNFTRLAWLKRSSKCGHFDTSAVKLCCVEISQHSVDLLKKQHIWQHFNENVAFLCSSSLGDFSWFFVFFYITATQDVFWRGFTTGKTGRKVSY